MANAMTSSLRLAHAGWVLARYDALLPPDQLAKAPWLVRLGMKIAQLDKVNTVEGGQHNQLTAALSRLGPSYIKLGQFLATRPDIIGAKRAFELKALQDKLPPFPQAEAEAVVEAELGKPVAELFKTHTRFELRPGTTADELFSLAQQLQLNVSKNFDFNDLKF